MFLYKFLQYSNIFTDDCTKIKTYVGDDGKLHFVDRTGADSVLPFSSGGGLTLLTTGSGNGTYTYTGNDASTLTASNFIVCKTTMSASKSFTDKISESYSVRYTMSFTSKEPTISYNASTGVVTLSNLVFSCTVKYSYSDQSGTKTSASGNYSWKLYLVK